MHVASAPAARPFRTGGSFGFEPGRLKGTKARLKGNLVPFHRSNEPFQILPGGPLPPHRSSKRRFSSIPLPSRNRDLPRWIDVLARGRLDGRATNRRALVDDRSEICTTNTKQAHVLARYECARKDVKERRDEGRSEEGGKRAGEKRDRGRKERGCDSRETSRSKVQVHAGACACPMACVPRGRR